MRTARVLVLILAVLPGVACEQPEPLGPTVPSPQASATASTTVLQVPANLQIGAGTKALIEACLGEPVTIVGDGLFVLHRTILADGSELWVLHRNPMGVFALGQVTGTRYRIGAADQFVQSFTPSDGLTQTFVATLRVVAPGGGSGFTGLILLHVTVTPEGQVTAVVQIVDIQCT